jgi:hypothetical protein
MKCEEFCHLGPDYLSGSLPQEAAAAMKAHAENCEACAADVAMWQQLGKLPELEPSPNLQRRFDALLSAYEEGQWERKKYQPRAPLAPSFGAMGWFSGMRFAAVAAALVVMLGLGYAAGNFMHSREDKDKEVAELRTELRETRELAMKSLMQASSPSDRLQGVSYTTHFDRPDPQVLGALMHTLRYDSSVDVRLAALDALRRYNAQPEVREGMVNSLSKQDSPMVQIALIDMLVEMKERRAAEQIKQLEQNTKANPLVRERARWGLRQLQG